MKNKLINMVRYLSFLILIVFCLVSCGNKEDNDTIVKEENKFYIDSFDYEITKNENISVNELSYSMSFDIVFSLNKNSTNRDLVVRIAGTQEKSFKFTMDYCNTENVVLPLPTAAYPYALLYYTASDEVSIMNATVKIRITTSDLIDDINKFLKIDCYSSKCEIVDNKKLTDAGTFKLNYSDTSSSDIVYYTFNDITESYEVVSIITNSKVFEIPAMYKNYPVRTIDAGAFKAATNIEKLVLPSTLTTIPEGLLSGMSNLKSLTLPFVGQKIKETGQTINTFGYIFGNTDYTNGIKIKQVSKDTNNTVLEYECCLPKDLTKVIVTGDSAIPYGAFSNCTMLEEIQITGDIQEIEEVAFMNCIQVKSFSLSNTVESIGDRAFEYFAHETDLNNLKLSDHLQTIGSNAFFGCEAITFELPKAFLESEVQIDYANTGIETILIPSGVTSIQEEAFKAFTTLKQIYLPKSLQSFGQAAFEGCNKIQNVFYEGSIYDWAQLTFANSKSNPLSYGTAKLYFDGATENKYPLEFPDTILNIKDYAFFGMKNINNVDLPNVVSIGQSAFSNSGIEDVQLGDCLETIGENAFSNCTKLTTIRIPKSVTKIGKDAFYQDTNLLQLSVPFIGQSQTENTFISYWFGGSSYQDNKLSLPTTLSQVFITNSTKIPSYAFSGCSKIQRISLDSNITEIMDYAFDSCTALAEIELNDTLETIGDFAFLDCISLKSILIPANVNTIGEEAFSGCVTLENLQFNCENATVKQKAFLDCLGLSKLELDDEIAILEEGAFKNCKGLEKIVLNKHISISKNLFADCSNIQSFTTAFIGNEANKQENFFAYFFGATSYSDGMNYVPSSLTKIRIKVETIPDNAFYGLKEVEDVVITGTTIGVSAFEKCNSISSLNLFEVENIKDNAFSECSALSSIVLPESLISIGNDAFSDTFVSSENKKVFYEGTIDLWSGIDFANNYSNPMAFASIFVCDCYEQAQETTDLSFVSAIEIKPYAFYGFSNVETIELSNLTTSVGASAFANMSNLIKFEAGNSLTSIDRNAFKSCSNLQEVVLNAKLNYIGEFAFMGCADITTLRYNATVNDWVKINFANQTANPIYAQTIYMLDETQNSYVLEDVYLDDTVEEISAYAFASSTIKTLHITTSLLKIGDNAFKNCVNLKDIYYTGTMEAYQQIENNLSSEDVEIHYNS